MTCVRVRNLAIVAVIGLGLFGGMTHAGTETELGIVGSLLLPDKDLLTGSPQHLVPAAGLRGGFVSGQFGWLLDGSYAKIDIDNGTDVDWLNLRTAVEFLSNRHTTRKQFFVTLGGGWLEAEKGPSKIQGSFGSVSFGQRFRPSTRTRIRWELRGDYSISLNGTNNDIAAVYGTVALTWGLGVEKPDTDGDGVKDPKDDCPGTPAGARVDSRGCPFDEDGDGVFDGLDRCPGTPRGWPVDAVGCPIDSDGDGVADGEDACPGTPRGAQVDALGCPGDTDGDGVLDGLDRCPSTPVGATVDANGCPSDSDGDGVYDGIDRCPNTPRDVMVDEFGCPVPAPLFDADSDEPLVLEGVFFEFNSADLTQSSKAVLDKVAASLVLHHSDVRVEVSGHTDSSGPAAFNLRFSRKRANAVRDYLIYRGVAADRLLADGFGESRPIADESTPGGAAKNRRVELRVLN